jgi:TonB family protein
MADYTRDIERYRKGEMSSAERHALERKALADPFLADALEGAEQLNVTDFANDVKAIVKTIDQQTPAKRNTFFTWPLRVAAGLLLLSVCTYLVWNSAEEQPTPPLALKTDEKSSEAITQPEGETSSSAPSEEKDAASKRSNNITVPAHQPSATASAPVTTVNPTEVPTETEAVLPARATEAIAEGQPVLEMTQDAASAKASTQEGIAYTIDAAKKEALVSEAERKANLRSVVRAETDIGLRGTVVSAEDGSPLPGVNVVVKGGTIGTVSDEHGRYVIDAAPESTLVFSFIGLQSQEVLVQNTNEVNVSMSVDATQLSEVVVTGYGIAKDEGPLTVDLAHPQIGYRAYKKYLEENMRYPQQAVSTKTEGRATIEFTVEPTGVLTNFNIVRGIGSGCDEELIRLVKEGPAWTPTRKEGIAVQDKVRVRLTFELPK